MKRVLTIVFSALALLSLSGCASLDVVGNDSVRAIGVIEKKLPNCVSVSKDSIDFTSPDGGAKIVFSKDMQQNDRDISMFIDSKPFVEAGLNLASLPKEMVENDKIVIYSDIDDSYIAGDSVNNIELIIRDIIDKNRYLLKYHTEMGHYAIDLGDGNSFVWSQDISKTEGDVVFSLDPSVFEAAGADLSKVDGWQVLTLNTMKDNGQPIEVQKLEKIIKIE